MIVLYVVESRPLSARARGGSGAVFSSRLELLHGAGARISLCILGAANGHSRFEGWTQDDPEAWSRIRSWCDEVLKIDAPASVLPRRGMVRRLLWITDPVRRAYPIVDRENTNRVKAAVRESTAGIVWAAGLIPALVCSRGEMPVPVVYEHHDWFWRVEALRRRDSRPGIKGIVVRGMKRRVEERLVRRVNACVTPSVTEVGSLRKHRARGAEYFPLTYAPTRPEASSDPPEDARVVHLGGLATTATNIGLQRFLDEVWPRFEVNPDFAPELWVVGDTSHGSACLLERLDRVNAVCPGFVSDLSPVLRPYDLHVVPWEHDTGTRTRVLTCFDHSQVLVAHRRSVAGLEGLESGKNCVLVEDLGQMGDCIEALARSPRDRVELGRAGHRTLLSRYSREVVQERFNAWLGRFADDAGHGY